MDRNGNSAFSPISSGIRDFLTWCRVERGLSRNSLAAPGRDLEALRSYAVFVTGGALPQTELLNKYVNQLYRKDLTSRSIARHMSSLRSFFSFLVTEEKLREDPTEHLTSPKQWSTIPKFLNREQIEQLISAPDITQPNGLRDRAMFELLYATGIRASELINLQLSSLDAGLGLLRVTGKVNMQRLVPVNARALAVVSSYLEQARF